MAYLIQQDRSPYWTAVWTSASGSKKKRSTKVRIKPDPIRDGIRETRSQARARAQQIADTFEQADTGHGVARRLHATINSLLPSGGVPTIERYLADYIARRCSISPKTASNDKRACDRLLAFLGTRASDTIDTLSTADVNAWLEYETSRVRISTVRLYRNCVHAPFRRAYEEELISRDPFSLARMPRSVETAPIVRRAFTLQDLKTLLAALSPEWALAVRCSVLLGGLRLGDVCNLTWSQFDFTKDTCKLITGKRGVPMEIPLLPTLKHQLLAWPRQGDAVLPTLYRRYNSPARTTLSTEFTSIVRGVGLGNMTGADTRSDTHGMTDLTFHMLRSMCATVLHEAGVDQAIAMRILSHNSAAVHQIYVRPSDSALRAGMEHLDKLEI